ncbi:MAG: gamma-glutamylcyclotransferase family protein [Saprospiraceae bacterium]|nr:gamma-glutamylcyclotransferase family protein [Saprospiraceae bacterium]
MTDLLFTYGTLMRGIPSKYAERLLQASDFLGEARVAGRLYDLGRYPGLISDPRSNKQVTGHIYKLKHPRTRLKQIDAYEGIIASIPTEQQEYSRIVVPVAHASGSLYCWAYVWKQFRPGTPEISGYYPDYWQSNERHRLFTQSS